MSSQIHQGVMNSWHLLKKFLKEEEIVRYSNGWNPLSSKLKIKKINEYHAKKKEESKEEAPVASTRKPQVNQIPQEGKKNKKRTGGDHLSQDTRSQKSQKMPWAMSSTWPEP
ncbi:hypothetical protein O181_106293 [Austropuccinia psidii MF-1]|uniref:Uncharacterized protein n=1 Tax=Austropuccinia psidii MF-1 TaxID=1389203 RepID=A0A9Q3JQJ4_9BASI|nr:hypothetical protein [Austropuccinia psidii MF-1]